MYQRPLRSDELMHYGVKGMKWGVRRYQKYSNKLGRLQKKQTKLLMKQKKLQGSTESLSSKVNKRQTKIMKAANGGLLRHPNSEKAQKLGKKQSKSVYKLKKKQAKLNRVNARTLKTQRKIMKTSKKMNKILNKYSVSTIDDLKRQVQVGESAAAVNKVATVNDTEKQKKSS